MSDAITCDPEVMHGAPVFRGTRVPVKTLFDYLENGESLDDFLAGFPTVSRDVAIQFSIRRLPIPVVRYCRTNFCTRLPS